ncbi:MAG: Crp/Fnr family transcriptional regulator [Muribaculum sp.]|nr:Crp/Fnr family transcriptional regulator [Muribaculaceae bacterium]MCM1081016.1 Crp/Fnr family transcriptional regulator [Muribaculum sp.]
MYEILMGLPLFKGVSHEKISEIIEKAKFHFLKYLEGESVVTTGEPCTHIKFIISGRVRLTIANHDERFRVSQTLGSPNVIAPDFLFGKAPFYPCSGVALEPTGILQISKSDYLSILNNDNVFLFNFLNILSMNAQKAVNGILAITSGSLEERIAFWIIALTQRNGEEISLSCRQRDLYSLFGVQRTSLINTLESMKNRDLIDYSSNEITIKSRDKLLELLSSSAD